jgi:hypothetical protein
VNHELAAGYKVAIASQLSKTPLLPGEVGVCVAPGAVVFERLILPMSHQWLMS